MGGADLRAEIEAQRRRRRGGGEGETREQNGGKCGGREEGFGELAEIGGGIVGQRFERDFERGEPVGGAAAAAGEDRGAQFLRGGIVQHFVLRRSTAVAALVLH